MRDRCLPQPDDSSSGVTGLGLAAERPTFRVGLPCRLLRGLALAEARLGRAEPFRVRSFDVSAFRLVAGRCSHLLQPEQFATAYLNRDGGNRVSRVTGSAAHSSSVYAKSVSYGSSRAISRVAFVDCAAKELAGRQRLYCSWSDNQDSNSSRLVVTGKPVRTRELGRSEQGPHSRRPYLAKCHCGGNRRSDPRREREGSASAPQSLRVRGLVQGHQGRTVASGFADPIVGSGPQGGEAAVRPGVSSGPESGAARVCAAGVASRESREEARGGLGDLREITRKRHSGTRQEIRGGLSDPSSHSGKRHNRTRQEIRRRSKNPRRIKCPRYSRTRQEIRPCDFNPPRIVLLDCILPVVQLVPTGPQRRDVRGRRQ